MGEAQAERKVSKRQVFYIPGYDPFPPRRYREIYRREAAKQAAVSGHRITLAPKAGEGPYGWQVTAEIEGAPVEAEVTVLVWSDIVRDSMQMGIAGTYLLMLRTFWVYLSTGAMQQLFRLRPGPVITAMYPPAMLVGQLLLALALAWGVGRLLGLVMPFWVGLLLGLAVVPPLLRWFRRIDGRLFVYYLLHDYAFTARDRGRYPPELEARMADFAARIGAALQGDADEVLVVGHSSGAHLGVSVVADVIRAGHVRPDGPALAFLTLGQAIPMQSFLPEADRLRGDLHFLAGSERLSWIDVSAPGDGCCYALCDPVAVSGAAPADKRWPLVVSAAFTQTLKPETLRRLRWRYFRLHVQYLCAFDNPGDYDYFRITAGPRLLADRYAGRKPSASRKEEVLSPYPLDRVA